MSEWARYSDREAWAEGVARACVWAIERGIERRGHAVAALAGGSTPAPVLPKLLAAALPWERVTLTVSDERQVDEDDPMSNIGQVRRAVRGTAGQRAAVVDLSGPFDEVLDLVWAGVGEDGHALSWFPGPDLEAAYSCPGPVVAVRPDPLPQAAPVARWTLTLPAARAAQTVLIAATGEAKRAVLEAPGGHPVARVLALPQTVVHWAP